MPEKIGKYEVVERVGRGGMGMIFKAHDPVLDRIVALKVISTDIEVTDELRARFFREAQACARLSHPNIVTVYDMGEHDGRLFIVMEFLEGTELRRLIAQRKALTLEDKLSVMLQVCDGLHYAHQRGIVHRDIKPGNIFLLRNGQVKILDFGIAQIATIEGGLTRTGLIMGTLRYISPEQVRGRADHRSDLFSVGAVFYEFLSFRPPFTGEDPIQILEQLRAEDPPSLIGLDPTIPPDLAAIVERAMRKDPGERFRDLETMRVELERVQRRITEEAQRVRGRLRGQLNELRELQAALAERIGWPAAEEAIQAFDERGSLGTLQALDREFADRIEVLRAKMARADSLAPAFQRGTELLQAGQFADAVMEFEAIAADMPEHARALEGLGQARAQAEAQRRQQLAAKLLQDARGALDEGGYALCVEILNQAEEIPPPAEAAEEIASLRQTAQAALAQQEAARRVRRQAEGAREQMAQVRRKAQGQTAPQYAPALWNEAEMKSADAQAAFAREAYVEAGQAFDAAAAAYRRFKEAAREAQLREREAAERAREQVARARERAQPAGAPQYARELWDAAEAKSAEAQAAFDKKALGHATGAFNEAVMLYRRAEEAAGEARQRERGLAEEARERAAQGRARAQAASDPPYARELWDTAEAKSGEAQAAFAQEAYAEAGQAFDAAAAAYRRFEGAVREAQLREGEAAALAREQGAEAGERARAAGAPQYARELWNAAEARSAEAQAAFGKKALGPATGLFNEAVMLYRRAEEAAGEARQRERARAEEAREQAAQGRERAQAASDPPYARELWDTAEAKSGEAQAAFAHEAYAEAGQAFDAAAAAYRRFEVAAREAQLREGEAAERAREQLAQARERAQTAGAPQYARELWGAAEAKSAEAQAAFGKKALGPVTGVFNEAVMLFRRAEEHASQARERERRRAEEARDRTAQGQRDAAAVEAQHVASALWNEASAKSTEAQSALQREQYAKAAEAFAGALVLYRRAENHAREAGRRQRDQAEQGRQAMAERRRTALAAEAASYAPSDWNEAEASAAAAEAAFAGEAHAEASRGFDEVAALYRRAEERARDAVRALEIARADADKGRQATALVRRAAAEAQASKYAAEQWGAGESTESRASAALGRQEHAAARSLFAEARRLYAAAAQTAGVAAEAEARRADAMMGDARRLFASGDVAACLRRLDQVLALKPGHPAAEGLRLQAEEKLRQVEAAAHEAEAAAQDATVHNLDNTTTIDPDVLAEPPTELIETPAAAVVIVEAPPLVAEPPTVVADAPSVLAEQLAANRPIPSVGSTRESAEAATVAGWTLPDDATAQTSATVYADPRRISPAASTIPEPASRRVPRGAIAWPWRFLRMGAFALGGLAATMAAIFYLLPKPSPLVSSHVERPTQAPQSPAPTVVPPVEPPAGRDAAEELRKRMIAAREEAVRADAERLAPAQFAAATEKAREGEAALGQRDMAAAQQRYREALDGYGLAKTEANRAAALAQKEADVRTAASQAAEARRAAELVGAPKLARALWADAGASQRKAEDALKQQAFDRAQALFGYAERTYRAAEKGASESGAASAADGARAAALKRDLEEAEQARAATARARQDAERSEASRLASRTFASAQQKESAGEASLNRQDSASAKQRFQEAQQAYKQAAQEAAAEQGRIAELQLQQSAAEQARDRMASARRAADQAGADQYAPKLLASAQTKEREGSAALGRPDYGLAARLFGDAQADYQAALQEAKREAEVERRQRTAFRANAEQSRSRTSSRRDEAVKAEADRLAKDLFDAAQAKQMEAEGLLGRESFAAATQAYQDAAEHYIEATLRAQAIREVKSQADSAKARMLAEKQRANQAAQEFGAALAEEKQGNSFYERLAYRDAAEKFRSAEMLFGRAAAKLTPPPPPGPARPRPVVPAF